jgi:hypothetical protein
VPAYAIPRFLLPLIGYGITGAAAIRILNTWKGWDAFWPIVALFVAVVVVRLLYGYWLDGWNEPPDEGWRAGF